MTSNQINSWGATQHHGVPLLVAFRSQVCCSPPVVWLMSSFDVQGFRFRFKYALVGVARLNPEGSRRGINQQHSRLLSDPFPDPSHGFSVQGFSDPCQDPFHGASVQGQECSQRGPGCCLADPFRIFYCFCL